jgi:hypothetical protein
MTTNTIEKKVIETSAWLALGALAGGLLGLSPIPDNQLVWSGATNAVHAPFFAIFTVILFRLSYLWFSDRLPLAAHLAVTAVVAIGMGVLSEAIQFLLPRDANLKDLVRNIVGITAGLLFCWAAVTSMRPVSRVLTIAIGIVLIAVPARPYLQAQAAYQYRASALPEIAVFSNPAASRFHEFSGVTATYSEDSIDVTFLAGIEDYPRFEITEVEPSWQDYSHLVADIVNLSPETLSLSFRVHDGHHSGAYADRFNAELELTPGRNRIAIPLINVRHAPANREMDMTDIHSVVFFLIRPEVETTLSFRSVHLASE